MIINKVVDGGPALKIPAHLSLGQHVIDCFRKICENEDSIALINGDTGEKTTYKQLLQGTVDVATGLKGLGVRRGDVVALCGENRPEYLIAAFAAVCCGATITTLNLMYTKEEIIHVLNISKPKFMFCSESALKEHLSTLKTVSSLKKIIQLDGTAVERSITLLNNVSVTGSDVDAFEPVQMDASDGAFILYSSGTTGLPKGVMLSSLNVLYSIALFEVDDYEQTSLISIVPWFHAYGLMSTINNVLVKCMLVYFSEGFNPMTYLQAIQEYKIRSLLVVPPIVVFLAKAPFVEEFDLSSIETVWCGAAPLSSETIAGAMKRMPNCTGIFQAYGMTETSLAATKDKTDNSTERKPGSGGYPIPGLKVKVVDIEKRTKLGPNEHGEICIKGPTIMKCYVGDQKATQDMIDEEGYLKTGDIGYYDVDGAFFIVDRLKELIKYKGYQVAPAEVESVILQHGGVAECGVVGMPDELAGELPTAFVVAKPGVELSKQDILDFTAARDSDSFIQKQYYTNTCECISVELASLFQLSRSSRLHGGVIIVDDIPKNPSGKILRRVLKQKLVIKKKSKI